MIASGEKSFTDYAEAEEFAFDKVKEYWVVHLRPVHEGKDGWVVAWWCQ